MLHPQMAHSSYACVFFASFDRRGVLDEQGLRVDGLLEISHRQKIGIRAEVWSTWNIFNPADSGGWGRLLGLGGYTETSFQYLLYSGYQYMESLPNWRLYPRPSTNLVHLYKKLCGYAYVSRQERFKNEEQTLSLSPYKYIYIYIYKWCTREKKHLQGLNDPRWTQTFLRLGDVGAAGHGGGVVPRGCFFVSRWSLGR